MKAIGRHFTKCFLAGIVALLPVGGLVLTVAYFEITIRDAGTRLLPFYFPGLGLLSVTVAVYLLGLFVSSLLGKWIWKWVDRFLESLPGMGGLYQTLKQILGYSEGKDAMFLRAVWVDTFSEIEELGLVTQEFEEHGKSRVCVFLPGSPNPTNGRMLVLSADRVRPADIEVNEAFKALLSTGKTPLTKTASA